ncbi:Uncharacterised protein [Bordetella pertussis]|nr:Uncharacterised protein [Bordetella pertussis]CFP68887.1 Uncharacterised protein [Bordetella pertussis]
MRDGLPGIDLLRGHARLAAHPVEHAFAPWAEALAGYVLVGLVVQDLDIRQVIQGQVARPARHAHVSQGGLESWQAGPFRQVLGVVPVVEFRFHAGGRFHGDKQQGFGVGHDAIAWICVAMAWIDE